jgi:beta-N-acetylhexosaminidase
MSSHVVFPAFDPEAPATLSERVIPLLLRGELGFDGVVFSDDMEMKAVADRWSVDEQVHRATRASVDVLLCCRAPTLQLQTFEALVRRQELDPGFEGATRSSMTRLLALRERFFLGAPPPPGLEVVGHADHRDLAHRVKARSEWSA